MVCLLACDPMEEAAPVQLERRSDGIAVLTLSSGKVNALSSRVLLELTRCAEDLHRNPPGAVIVTGGDRIFAAGADITEFGGREAAEKIGPIFHSAFAALSGIPRMVIAAVSGYALGGGCELALACDYRIASQRAVFGQPEILLGIIPGGGGTQRLARLVGPSRAKELCLSGRQVKAEEALRIGLCDEVVEPDQLMTRALEFAAQLASGAVLAQGMAKAAIDEGLQGTLEAGLARELTLFADVFETEDSQVGVQSFLAHGPGKATFSGR
jgi:enoyl-CoA hydratase/carnithine racemase